jgi:hypothetical protein
MALFDQGNGRLFVTTSGHPASGGNSRLFKDFTEYCPLFAKVDIVATQL